MGHRDEKEAKGFLKFHFTKPLVYFFYFGATTLKLNAPSNLARPKIVPDRLKCILYYDTILFHIHSYVLIYDNLSRAWKVLEVSSNSQLTLRIFSTLEIIIIFSYIPFILMSRGLEISLDKFYWPALGHHGGWLGLSGTKISPSYCKLLFLFTRTCNTKKLQLCHYLLEIFVPHLFVIVYTIQKLDLYVFIIYSK